MFGRGDYAKELPDGRYSIDMWSIMRSQLEKSGIMPCNISMADACSCCDEENFFSHRRGAGRSGIMLAVIQLREG